MAINKNPYGVGYSGENAYDRPRSCECCGIKYLWHGTAQMEALPAICPPCTKHSDDTLELEVEAHREHQPRLIKAVSAAHEMTRATKMENSRLEGENKEKRRQVAAAYKARDRYRYRSIVETFEGRHQRDGKKCTCGDNDCKILEVLNKNRPPSDWDYWPR